VDQSVRAVLYSDQVIPENAEVDRHLLALLSGKRRLGYVPSGPEPDRRFFTERQTYYRKLGLDLAVFGEPAAFEKQAGSNDLFDCDAIHLAGGDTASFLRHIKAAGLAERLRGWALSGGLLIGTSAGAILMTPTIAVDALFRGGSTKGGDGLAALDLLPFQFFPHVHAKPSYLPALMTYSNTSRWPIAACPDGGGVVVSEGRIKPVGDLLWIDKGEVSRMREMAF
jgi:dipeptidase E